MLRLSRLAARIALISGALTLAACVPHSTTTRPTKPVPDPVPVATPSGDVDVRKPVKVAFLAPSSAANAGAAALGRALVNAARMGEADLADPLLDLVFYDTRGDALAARDAAERAADNGAKIVLGPLFSANTTAVASVAAANGLKVISFSTDSTAAGGPVYLSGFLPEKEAARVFGYARSQGISTTGIFFPQTPLGEVAYSGATAAAGGSLVAVTAYPRSEQGIIDSAAVFANEVRATGAQGLMVAESGQALNFAMEQLSENEITAEEFRFLGLGQWNSKALLRSVKFANAWFPAPDPNSMGLFVERYQARYGEVPPPLAVLGYDAVQIAGQMLAEARANGSTEPFSDTAITRPGGFYGAVGPIRFDRSGLGERAMVILQVGDVSFDIVDPAPVVFGAGS